MGCSGSTEKAKKPLNKAAKDAGKSVTKAANKTVSRNLKPANAAKGSSNTPALPSKTVARKSSEPVPVDKIQGYGNLKVEPPVIENKNLDK